MMDDGPDQHEPHRVEMNRSPGDANDHQRFFGRTAAGRPIFVALDFATWTALGQPDQFVIRVRQ
jgi:hypothetical protein